MKRIIALTVALLLAPCAYLASADTDQGDLNGPPKLSDHAPAGPQCKRKVKLNAWLTTPAVEFLKTSRCVIEMHTCTGVKKYKSEPRANGNAICDDYRKVLEALASRETCCDKPPTGL
jgi:hypothetical protein